MKRAIVITVLLVMMMPVAAQKKLVPVTTSPLTGAVLPVGSKLDQRGLSIAGAKMFLNDVAKKSGGNMNAAEVLLLPAIKKSGYTADSFYQRLSAAGWTVCPDSSDKAYAWLQRDAVYVLCYWNSNAVNTDVYLGKSSAVPQLPGLTMPAPVNDPLPPAVIQTETPPVAADPAISGTWFTYSLISNQQTSSYIKKQYSFEADGSYTFYKKTFDVNWTYILLTSEKGTYKVADNTLQLNPVTVVTEKWAKKDRADKWGNRISSEKRNPEKTSYTIAWDDFSGVGKMTLILKTPKPTERDGAYASNSAYPNSYMYERPPTPDYLIELPVKEETPAPVAKIETPAAGGFSFTRTEFDNGWVSTIEEDKVVVTKAAVKVYIYFPFAYDDVSRAAGRDYFWDNNISKDFRVISKQYKDDGEYISSLKPPYIEGRAVENKTGKEGFLGLYIGSASGYMYPTLVIAPDEATLRSFFPKANDKYQSDLSAMRDYNKFAIGKNDITGYWVGSASAAMDYYNAYNGSYLGMNAAVSSDEFTFNSNGTYSSTHKGATGMVGSMNIYQQQYKGNVTVSNWEITIDHRFDGKTEINYAYFEAVRGGRILHLQNKKFTGQWYHLVKKGN